LQSVKKKIDSMDNHPNPMSYSSAKGRGYSQLDHSTLTVSKNHQSGKSSIIVGLAQEMINLKSLEQLSRQQNHSLQKGGGRLSELINYRNQVQERLHAIIGGENSQKAMKGRHRESLSIGSNLS
jgi:hypothetical protein